MEYKPGDQVCSCTLIRKCGTGAYGEVWLAEDSVGARIAVKIIRCRGRYSERELAGIRNYRDCNHPNLLKIRFVEITDDRICCLMDAADDLNRGKGEYKPDTLANRLEKYGRMEGCEIIAMLDGLLAGLEELHSRGLVHRDIKPDNILWVNGRPTLADAGLIAHEGTGSLVGTPGFMSPKLFCGKGSPDASDDFYALGKVIYCALTGLPVGEYPSIPENMTISADAALGRVFRESCRNPVHSSAEFRKLMQGKPRPEPPADAPRTGKMNVRTELIPRPGKILLLLLLLLPAGGLLFLFVKSGNGDRNAAGLTPEEEAELDATLQEARSKLAESQAEMQTAIEKFKAPLFEVRDRTAAFFRKKGFLPGTGSLLPGLLQYQPMTGEEIRNLLMYSNRTPRLQPAAGVHPRTSKSFSELEQALYKMFLASYPDFDSERVKERQDFWRRQKDPAETVQRRMLELDPLMQALVLDSMIRDLVNGVLKNDWFRDEEEQELTALLQLRSELLVPGMRMLRSMEKRTGG